MPLMSEQDFASLFIDLPPVKEPDWPTYGTTLGACWLGESALTKIVSMRKRTFYRELQAPGADDDGPLEFFSMENKIITMWGEDWDFSRSKRSPKDTLTYYLLHSSCRELLFCASSRRTGALTDILRTASILRYAKDNFSVDLNTISGNDDLRHSFNFTVLKGRSADELRHNLSSVHDFMRPPAELWAACWQKTGDGSTIALFSLVDGHEGPLDEPRCILALEDFAPFKEKNIPPTVCMFWWHSQPRERVVRVQSKTVQVRVQVTV